MQHLFLLLFLLPFRLLQTILAVIQTIIVVLLLRLVRWVLVFVYRLVFAHFYVWIVLGGLSQDMLEGAAIWNADRNRPGTPRRCNTQASVYNSPRPGYKH